MNNGVDIRRNAKKEEEKTGSNPVKPKETQKAMVQATKEQENAIIDEELDSKTGKIVFKPRVLNFLLGKKQEFQRKLDFLDETKTAKLLIYSLF